MHSSHDIAWQPCSWESILCSPTKAHRGHVLKASSSKHLPLKEKRHVVTKVHYHFFAKSVARSCLGLSFKQSSHLTTEHYR